MVRDREGGDLVPLDQVLEVGNAVVEDRAVGESRVHVGIELEHHTLKGGKAAKKTFSNEGTNQRDFISFQERPPISHEYRRYRVNLMEVEGILDSVKLLIKAGTYDDVIFQLKECIDMLEKEKLKVQASADAKAKANVNKPVKPVLPSA